MQTKLVGPSFGGQASLEVLKINLLPTLGSGVSPSKTLTSSAFKFSSSGQLMKELHRPSVLLRTFALPASVDGENK